MRLRSRGGGGAGPRRGGGSDEALQPLSRHGLQGALALAGRPAPRVEDRDLPGVQGEGRAMISLGVILAIVETILILWLIWGLDKESS